MVVVPNESCLQIHPLRSSQETTILTSITPENEDVPINNYPIHSAALENAGLVSPDHQYPTYSSRI